MKTHSSLLCNCQCIDGSPQYFAQPPRGLDAAPHCHDDDDNDDDDDDDDDDVNDDDDDDDDDDELTSPLPRVARQLNVSSVLGYSEKS